MMPDPLSFTCVLKDPNGNFVEVSVVRVGLASRFTFT
jgi:hypothetical protein